MSRDTNASGNLQTEGLENENVGYPGDVFHLNSTCSTFCCTRYNSEHSREEWAQKYSNAQVSDKPFDPAIMLPLSSPGNASFVKIDVNPLIEPGVPFLGNYPKDTSLMFKSTSDSNVGCF